MFHYILVTHTYDAESGGCGINLAGTVTEQMLMGNCIRVIQTYAFELMLQSETLGEVSAYASLFYF